MPGNYTITSRADGLVLTAAIYNADHQNHVDNQTPAGTDDYSVNLTQMLLTTDPGETGSESLATSMAGEIERLRFAIAEMKGVLWHVSNAVRNTGMMVTTTALDATIWTATGTTGVQFRARIPDGWSSGSTLTLKLLRSTLAAPTGTAKMTYTIFRSRDNTAQIIVTTATAIDFTPAEANAHLLSVAVAGASYAAGDLITFAVTRLGDDAGDTEASIIVLHGHWLEYTGIAGR